MGMYFWVYVLVGGGVCVKVCVHVSVWGWQCRWRGVLVICLCLCVCVGGLGCLYEGVGACECVGVGMRLDGCSGSVCIFVYCVWVGGRMCV